MAHVPELLVVLLCILGGGALVTVCAAFGKALFSKEQPENHFNQRSPEQDSYMQKVREINQASIWGLVRSQRKADRRQRDVEAIDLEIQSGRSRSNGGLHSADAHGQGHGQGHGHHGGGYRNQGHSHTHTPIPYYEEDYSGPNYSPGGHEEQQQQQQQQQQKPYTSGQANLYATHHSKPGVTETWNEVPR